MAKIIKFSSGLVACYQRKRSSLGCAFGVFVNIGSSDEEENNNGVAHFVEHMMFKGTETRNSFELAKAFDACGSASNAYTGRFTTAYYAQGLAKYTDTFAMLLSDMLFHHTFRKEDVEKERGVIIEEINMYKDDPSSVCSDLLSEKSFGKCFYGRPILGTKESVENIDSEKLHSFVNKMYTPKNIALSYVGPMSEEEFRALAEKYFESEFAKKKSEYNEKRVEKIKVRKGYFKDCSREFEQSNVIIRFPAVKRSSKLADASIFLSSILGGEMSSRLFQKLREELGCVYEIDCDAICQKHFGYLDIEFATTPEKTKMALLAIREELEKFRKEGVLDEELQKAKLKSETSSVMGEAYLSLTMRRMPASYFMTGKIESLKTTLRRKEKVTKEDIMQAFDKIFDYNKASICYVGKKIDDDLEKAFRSGE